MLGKTFKGLTDEMLAWQTKKFLELEIGRDQHTVFVRPEVVAEIAFNEIQASSQYPGGVTLRFARVKRYRDDKPASEADTIATIQQMIKPRFSWADSRVSGGSRTCPAPRPPIARSGRDLVALAAHAGVAPCPGRSA